MVEPEAGNTAREMTVDGDNCVEPEADNTDREMTVDGENCVETETDNTTRKMTRDGDNFVETVETLPDKSRSLRRSSVQKRLLTEAARSAPQGRVRAKISKKYRLSKYRRKTENAKERERMKKFNEAFTTLRKILPNSKLSDNNAQCEKDTKVCYTS